MLHLLQALSASSVTLCHMCDGRRLPTCRCEDIPLNCKPYDGPACAKVVPTYGACGGLGSDCVGCQCKDGPWDGYCCEKGEWRVTLGAARLPAVPQGPCMFIQSLAGC